MPEGPEVKRIGENLAKLVSGKTLISAEILSGRYKKKLPTGWNDLILQLPIRVIGPGVHGKFCYWICDNETFIYSTMGMSGTWSNLQNEHSRIKFTLDNNQIVFFNDPRNFGTIKIVRGKHEMIKKLRSLGPDMLTENLSDQDFIQAIRKKDSWGITKALMDQSVIAGVGNYIKADSLYLARISPHRTVKDITDGELAMLNRSIKQVMLESFQSGKDYGTGYKTLIYGKKTDQDGYAIKKEETSDKRATYWCPEVQK